MALIEVTYEDLSEIWARRNFIYRVLHPFFRDKYSVKAEIKVCREIIKRFENATAPRSTSRFCLKKFTPKYVLEGYPGGDCEWTSKNGGKFYEGKDECIERATERLEELEQERAQQEAKKFVKEEKTYTKEVKTDDIDLQSGNIVKYYHEVLEGYEGNNKEQIEQLVQDLKEKVEAVESGDEKSEKELIKAYKVKVAELEKSGRALPGIKTEVGMSYNTFQFDVDYNKPGRDLSELVNIYRKRAAVLTVVLADGKDDKELKPEVMGEVNDIRENYNPDFAMKKDIYYKSCEFYGEGAAGFNQTTGELTLNISPAQLEVVQNKISRKKQKELEEIKTTDRSKEPGKTYVNNILGEFSAEVSEQIDNKKKDLKKDLPTSFRICELYINKYADFISGRKDEFEKKLKDLNEKIGKAESAHELESLQSEFNNLINDVKSKCRDNLKNKVSKIGQINEINFLPGEPWDRFKDTINSFEYLNKNELDVNSLTQFEIAKLGEEIKQFEALGGTKVLKQNDKIFELSAILDSLGDEDKVGGKTVKEYKEQLSKLNSKEAVKEFFEDKANGYQSIIAHKQKMLDSIKVEDQNIKSNMEQFMEEEVKACDLIIKSADDLNEKIVEKAKRVKQKTELRKAQIKILGEKACSTKFADRWKGDPALDDNIGYKKSDIDWNKFNISCIGDKNEGLGSAISLVKVVKNIFQNNEQTNDFNERVKAQESLDDVLNYVGNGENLKKVKGQFKNLVDKIKASADFLNEEKFSELKRKVEELSTDALSKVADYVELGKQVGTLEDKYNYLPDMYDIYEMNEIVKIEGISDFVQKLEGIEITDEKQVKYIKAQLEKLCLDTKAILKEQLEYLSEKKGVTNQQVAKNLLDKQSWTKGDFESVMQVITTEKQKNVSSKGKTKADLEKKIDEYIQRLAVLEDLTWQDAAVDPSQAQAENLNKIEAAKKKLIELKGKLDESIKSPLGFYGHYKIEMKKILKESGLVKVRKTQDNNTKKMEFSR